MKSLMPRHIGAFALLALLAVLCGWSQQSGVRHELRIQYRLGYRYYDGDLDGNQKRLDAFLAAYRAAGDSLPVVVTGSASPEGGTKWRGPLARKRAEELIKVLERNGIPASRVTISDAQVNWKQLRDSVAANPQLPWTEKVLEILDAHEGDEVATKRKLHAVDRDRAWKYMLRHYFPPMRYGLAYFDQPLPPPQPEPEPEVIEEVREVVEEVVETPPAPVAEPAPKVLPPHYWALKTNMIHDLILVPNIGLEWYVGKNLSVEADYSGAWWGTKYRTHLWRYYGGNVQLNYYFKGKSEADAGFTPFRGWHVGVYGEMASYDFQFGRRGYQGKVAGGGGLVGGYTLPLNRHFSLDLMLGLGFFGGRYKVCRYMDGHEVWIETRMRNWWGPTRIGVTLSWLLGRGNNNRVDSQERIAESLPAQEGQEGGGL